MPKLSEAQRNILAGLDSGHAYVSASEAVELNWLRDSGLVDTWVTIGGFAAWRLTPAGRAALAEEDGDET